MRHPGHLVALAILGAVALAACSTAPPGKSALMQSVEGLDVTRRELQTVMYAFANHFAGQVELACNEIYNSTADPAVRRAAIEWNLNATPPMMMACFNHDPLVGMLSAWSFAIQVRFFFDEGAGRDAFGPQQHIAVTTARGLEEDMSKLARAVWPQGDIDEYEQLAHDFAAAHPVKNMRFVREGFDARTLEAMGADVAGGLGVAGAMNEQMVALTDRANIMMPYLQRQIYWQSALLMEDSRTLAADLADSTLASVSEEAFGHLGPLFEFVDEERALVARDVAHERAAVLTAIAEERREILIFLADERNAVITAIANERNATMRDLDTLTRATFERVIQESQATVFEGVDHIYTRTLQLLVIPFLALGLFMVVVMLWVRKTVNRALVHAERRTAD